MATNTAQSSAGIYAGADLVIENSVVAAVSGGNGIESGSGSITVSGADTVVTAESTGTLNTEGYTHGLAIKGGFNYGEGAGSETPAITLNDGLTITQPAGGKIGELSYEEDPFNCVLDADSMPVQKAVIKVPEPHSHCICGSETDMTGHTSHSEVTYTEWDGTTDLSAGNYYLTGDIAHSDNAIFAEGNVNLCLNGYTMERSISVQESAVLNICDCGGNGKITIDANVINYNKSNAAVSLYSGSLIGTSDGNTVIDGDNASNSKFYLYGGTVSHTGANIPLATNRGEIYLYGGTVTGSNNHGVIAAANGKIYLCGDTVINPGTGKDSIKVLGANVIDASDYTGEYKLSINYAKEAPENNEVVVTNITEANKGKFTLSYPEGKMLEVSGDKLVLADLIVPITSVTISGVDFPVEGAEAKGSHGVTGTPSGGFHGTLGLMWRSNGAGITTTTFEAGKTYGFMVTIKKNDGYTFGQSGEYTGTVNLPDGFTLASAEVRNDGTLKVTTTEQLPTLLPDLGGTVSISGMNRFGQTLTANTSALDFNGDEDGNGTAGTLTYKWYRDSEVISGASGSTYVLVAADIGHQIFVEVASSNAKGSIKSGGTSVVQKAACSTAVSRPTLNATSDTVTVINVTRGHEYAITTEDTQPTSGWNTTGVFTGLNLNTEYTVYARVAETETHNASFAVTETVTTSKLTQVITVNSANPTVIIGGELDLATLCSSNAAGATLTYTVDGTAPTGMSLSGSKVTVADNTAADSILTIKVNSAAVGDYSAADEKTITVKATAKASQTFKEGFDTAVNRTYGDIDFVKWAVLATGDGTISYASSNPDVATVNATTGEVKILKNGTTTITATAAETTDFAGTSVSYTLTVVQHEVAIQWSNTTNRVYGDGKTVTANITNKVGTDDIALTVTNGDKTDVGGPYTAAAALTGTDAGKYKLPAVNTIEYSITKAAQAAPTGLAGVKPTTVGGTDGKITGTTDKMEYATKTDFSDKVTCTGTEITGLAAGKYYVRYAETATHDASDSVEVTVPAKTSSGSSGGVNTYSIAVDVRGS